LLDDPPPGIRYVTRSGRHHFAFADRHATAGAALAPFRHPHLGEFVDFGPGPQFVQMERWPVLNRKSWVAETDDFGYPYVIGRHTLSRKFERPSSEVWTDELEEFMRMRAANMLCAFAHPSCGAVIFVTRRSLEGARTWARRLNLDREAEPFFEKTCVIYPAHRAMLPTLVEQKWKDVSKLKVLFVGKDYWVKNGRLTLKLFRRLADEFPYARFTYVGLVPPEDVDLAEGIDFRGTLPRREVLKLFKESHILFHPATDESFGVVFVEAAAYGLAVVAAKGPGLGHLDEVFDDREAMLVSQDLTPEPGEEDFEACLRPLLADPGLARQKALAFYQNALTGKFSVSEHNNALRVVYQRALHNRARSGLTLDALPYWRQFEHLTLDSDQISPALKTFCDEEGIRKSNFYIHLEDQREPAKEGAGPAEAAHTTGRRGGDRRE
jgi:glycosyltransferase involved in cell wall biosynthesis